MGTIILIIIGIIAYCIAAPLLAYGITWLVCRDKTDEDGSFAEKITIFLTLAFLAVGVVGCWHAIPGDESSGSSSSSTTKQDIMKDRIDKCARGFSKDCNITKGF